LGAAKMRSRGKQVCQAAIAYPDAPVEAPQEPPPSKFRRVPTEQPPFTLGQLRRAIPDHCFERSLLTSSLYLVTDLALVAALYVAR
jgi:Domain of unknown function (DUF3474)